MAEAGFAIDRRDGEITLPNGLRLGPVLALGDLIADDWPVEPKVTVPADAPHAFWSTGPTRCGC